MEKTNQNQIQVPKSQSEPSTLKRFNACIARVETQNYLEQVLGEKKSPFVNNVTALVANNASLQMCQPMTLIYAALKATALDLPLDPNLGFAYVIPYNDRKAGVTNAQFQIGYKGFIQLGIRSGQFLKINVTEIVDGELVSEDLLTGDIKICRVTDRESRPVIGYAAYFALVNGFSKTLYMSVDEIKAHAGKYSQTYSSKNEYVRNSSKWTTDFDSMAKKTVLKLLLSKYAPMSVDMAAAITADQAAIDSEGRAYYIDNPAPDDQTPEDKASEVECHKAEMRMSSSAAKVSETLL